MDIPKSVSRPKRWSAEVEDAYRFQLAGYRDENEYTQVQKVEEVLVFIPTCLSSPLMHFT